MIGFVLFAAFACPCGEAANVRLNPKSSQERELIESLDNWPLCKGKEPCLADCLMTQQKPWNDCLTLCLGDNPMLQECGPT